MTAGSTVPKSAFKFVSGQELLKSFESSPGKHRYFCSECGSHIYAFKPAEPSTLRLRVATIDTPLANKASAQIHTDSGAEWYAPE